MKPPRPTRQDAKGDWQRWAWDSFIALTPQAGPGVVTNVLTGGTLRRLMRKNRNRRLEEPSEVLTFGFVYSTAQGLIKWTFVNDSAGNVRHEYDQYTVIVGYGPIPFPGGSGGLALPQVFRIINPLTRSVSVTTSIDAPWAQPQPWPKILGPGEFVDFQLTEVGNGAHAWSVTAL